MTDTYTLTPLGDAAAQFATVRALTCSCGRIYSEGEYARLPLVGYMDDDTDGHDHDVLEMRNCPCGSTMAVARQVILP